jgi:hypothetical protein
MARATTRGRHPERGKKVQQRHAEVNDYGGACTDLPSLEILRDNPLIYPLLEALLPSYPFWLTRSVIGFTLVVSHVNARQPSFQPPSMVESSA